MNGKNIPWILLEDERYTAAELQRLVARVSPEYFNLAVIDTCHGFRKYWEQNPRPDLIIADEQLADGRITPLLQDMDISTPIILVTWNETYRCSDIHPSIIDILLHPVLYEHMQAALFTFQSSN